MQKIVLIFAILFGSVPLIADEIKLAYLEIEQHSTNSYAVLYKSPSKNLKKPFLDEVFPADCITSLPVKSYVTNKMYREHMTVDCQGTLEGKTLSLEPLNRSDIDMLLHMDLSSGKTISKLLSSSEKTYNIPDKSAGTDIAGTYTWLGITHILIGFDHLLFVFALLLIVQSTRRLLWTISAFTLAHSLTMAGAMLGLVQMPQKPVEAVIALSILFLALEIMHEKQGKIGLTSRYPWAIAFIFGLLHGFGFAGALAEVGVPEDAIVLSLLFFNIGVELGQLIFVASIVFVAYVLQQLKYNDVVERLKTLIVYGMGSISTFWLIERTLSF